MDLREFAILLIAVTKTPPTYAHTTMLVMLVPRVQTTQHLYMA
jgi:hypothetical protein